MSKPKGKPNLKCPYTGARMEIVFDDNLKHVGYYAQGGFDPAIPFLDKGSATKALLLRNGKSVKGALACPYTGKPLTLVERKGLWWVEGDFCSPGKHLWAKSDVEYALSTRAGVKPKNLPKPTVVEGGEEKIETSDPRFGLGKDNDTEGLVNEFLERVER